MLVLLLLCACGKSISNGPPKAGDHVLVRSESLAYEPATIKSIEGDSAKVVFDRSPREVSVKFPSEILQIPTAPSQVAPGDYVWAQYPYDNKNHPEMWLAGLVNSVSGATANVKFGSPSADKDVARYRLVKAPEGDIPAMKKEVNWP